jgi:PAS domain S-box-containing protein
VPNENPNIVSPDRYLASIIDSSDDAIISKSLDGIILSWNKAAEKIFGYTQAEAVGMPISLLVPPDRASEEPDILTRIRRGERLDHYETKRLRKDGRLIDVSLTISPILAADGTIVGASKIARDITEAKRVHELIRLERERLRVTLGSIGDAVIVTDTMGMVEFLNPVAEALTGWSATEATGKPLETVFCIVNEQTRHRVESPAARAMREGIVVGLANHTILIPRDGAELAIDDSAAPIRDSHGNISGVILVFRDVSGARAVADFQSRLSAIVENSDDAIVSKDLTGRIISWNKGAETIFGYTQQEAVGRPITMIIPPDRLHEESAILAKIRAGEKVDHLETIRLSKGRRAIHVSVTISPIRNAHGEVVGASKIARDITDKKQKEQDLAAAHARLQEHAGELERTVARRTAELTETVAELETFSSSLSHDLKAPLRTINSFAGALLEDHGAELSPGARGFAERIVQGCKRLSRFVDSVLAYTRLRNSSLAVGSVDLDQVVAAVLEEYPYLKEANATLELAQPLGSVRANELLLTQLLSNLLSNAVKFVPPGVPPKIRISSEIRDHHIRLSIQDNGIGIPQKDQARIFALFTRLHGEDEFPGSGVGLALVDRAVRRMGGSVGVESREGQGSRFWIELQKDGKDRVIEKSR